MTLTPVPLPVPAALAGQMPAGGGEPGMLQPLPAGGPNSFPRLQHLLREMASDLLSRVLLDRCVASEEWLQRLHQTS